MFGQRRDTVGRAEPVEIAAVREQAQRHFADFACNQTVLRRPNHTHGDIGIAAQQIVSAIVEREFETDLRKSKADIGDLVMLFALLLLRLRYC